MLGAAVVALAVAAGCSPTPLAVDGLRAGMALGSEGPQTMGTYGMTDTKVGTTYRVAFPELTNDSTTPLAVVGYPWHTIPTGVRIGAVHVYDANRSDGLVLSYTEGEDDGEGLSHLHDYAGQPLRLAPKEESSRYAMISFTVTARTKGSFQGCVIVYRQGGREYSQTFHCHVVLSS